MHYIRLLLLPPFHGHYTGQPALAGNEELEGFVEAKFYCPHAN